MDSLKFQLNFDELMNFFAELIDDLSQPLRQYSLPLAQLSKPRERKWDVPNMKIHALNRL